MIAMKRLLPALSILAFLGACPLLALRASSDKKPPQSSDPRLRIDLFATAPDIVHPIGVAFDSCGRLLVIESHTHFRPQNYQGPKHDRVRIVEDADGDGKADRFTTFFEGTQATMDIALHPDGSVYLATRNEILRLRDNDGDGKADEQRRLVFLDTNGNYPHNGLSGLAFDSKGNLFFGLGENLAKSAPACSSAPTWMNTPTWMPKATPSNSTRAPSSKAVPCPHRSCRMDWPSGGRWGSETISALPSARLCVWSRGVGVVARPGLKPRLT
jgi:glucose/arabinose dehydrogenase